MIKLNQQLSEYLESINFKLKESNSRLVYEKGIFQIIFVEQRGTRIETWILKEHERPLRIGFLLEYYFTQDVILTREKLKATNPEKAKEEYIISFLDKFFPKLQNEMENHFNKFEDWVENKEEVEKARQLIRT